jgi:hypothetical protein
MPSAQKRPRASKQTWLAVVAVVFLLVALSLAANAGSAPTAHQAPASAERITADQMRDYLFFIASDELEGRRAPSRGLDIAAKFIATLLSRWGLTPAGDDGGFLQMIEVESGSGSAWTQNVVGILEGSDPLLRHEYVALGAHLDHVGIGRPVDGDAIYNGADDDGSGTTALLAMAEAFAKGDRPRRSILFVWHTGEEVGMWGSRHVNENPPVPVGQIVAHLNIDMIGRSKAPGDTEPANADLTGPHEIYVIGPRIMNDELGAIIDEVNHGYLDLEIDPLYDAVDHPARFFFRSDHIHYARNGIPIAFFFSGTHEDYHRPSDHADKIDYEKMERVARTIYAVAWELANREGRPGLNAVLPPEIRRR